MATSVSNQTPRLQTASTDTCEQMGRSVNSTDGRTTVSQDEKSIFSVSELAHFEMTCRYKGYIKTEGWSDQKTHQNVKTSAVSVNLVKMMLTA